MTRALAPTRRALPGFVAAAAVAQLVAGTSVVLMRASTAEPLEFQVTLSRAAVEEVARLGLETPIAGRLFVLVSRDKGGEPREQVDVHGTPFWGRDVSGLGPESTTVLDPRDAGVRGYPIEIGRLPPGRYTVQAFLNVYSTFHRADGHTLLLHQETGEGQDLWRSPGNVTGAPIEVEISAERGGRVALALDRVIPPIEPVPPGGVLQQGNPKDTALVKFVKMKSEVLSRFWGRPMYIGANVLLPRDYDKDVNLRYPVVYLQGHFPGRAAPFGYVEPGAGVGAPSSRSRGFTEFWHSSTAPKVVVVTIRDANPYYDTSYSVDSANVGPYGEAITRELMPMLEQRFRLVPEAWGRVLAGGSTGGWEALAMQAFYPDVFGGAWGWCPDAVDFRYHQIVNVYDDANAYVQKKGWTEVERPNTRQPDGSVTSTVRMENHMELAIGPRNRSGGQWSIWEAVYGPTAPDGYPQPIWDPETGAVDHEVADYWRNHFDLREYLKRHWATIGPKLTGKIHVAVGDMDTYFLEEAVYLLEDLMKTLDNPPAAATFEYGRRKPHCWIGASRAHPNEDLDNAEFVAIAAAEVASRAPASADRRWYTAAAGGR